MAARPSQASARSKRHPISVVLAIACALAPIAIDAHADVIAGDWTVNGVPVATGPGEVLSGLPVPDAAGGFYLVWTARLTGSTSSEVRVTRVYSSGTLDPHWPADGVLLGPNSGVIGAWPHPSGGLVVAVGRRVWRLTSLGTHANGWLAAGKLLEPMTNGQFSVGIDGGGRVWALGASDDFGCAPPLPSHPPYCWSVARYHAVRLDSSGNYEPGWEPPGRLVFEDGGRESPVLPPSLKGVPGGIAFACSDRASVVNGKRLLRVGYVFNDGSAQIGPVDESDEGYLYVDQMHWDVDATGAIFVNDGWSTRTSAVNKHTPNRLWTWPGWKFPVTLAFGLTARLFADEAGGAYVQSIAEILNPRGIRHFVHHVLPNGASDSRWPLLGIELSSAASLNLTSYASTSDGRGGYFATWPQTNGADADIHAVRILADGSTPPGWNPSGTPVCNLVGSHQIRPMPVADASGNVFVVWLDARNGAAQVFAQKLGVDSPVPVAIASASAELAEGGVRLTWRMRDPEPLLAERSTDGIEWVSLGELRSGGGSELWTATDARPVLGALNQYRLREPVTGWTGGNVSILVPAGVLQSFVSISPNPVRGAPRIRFATTRSAPLEFVVTDVQGRELARRRAISSSDGAGEFGWDELGRLPLGLYWLRLSLADGSVQSTRFAVVR